MKMLFLGILGLSIMGCEKEHKVNQGPKAIGPNESVAIGIESKVTGRLDPWTGKEISFHGSQLNKEQNNEQR